uniref:Uncharacterized protein n=1 Tax=Knipowitschia caucasica TaxID=637954 RepID=A0AAV2L0A7_KNICA
MDGGAADESWTFCHGWQKSCHRAAQSKLKEIHSRDSLDRAHSPHHAAPHQAAPHQAALHQAALHHAVPHHAAPHQAAMRRSTPYHAAPLKGGGTAV